MPTWDAYQSSARAYAAGMRSVMVTSEPARSVSPDAPRPLGLAERAALLAPLSDDLLAAAGALLEGDDAAARGEVGARLLAKAAADLQVSAYLVQAAGAEEATTVAARDGRPLRRRFPQARMEELTEIEPADVEETLAALLAPPPAAARPFAAALRGPVPIPEPASRIEARLRLAGVIVDTILAIRDHAAQAGQSALGGLLGLSATELAQAARIAALDAAQALGLAENVDQLYRLASDFAVRAFEALQALLGPRLIHAAADQGISWITQLRFSPEFGRQLSKLYGTSELGEQLGRMLLTSQASEEQLGGATEALVTLRSEYEHQTHLAGKVLRLLSLMGVAPAAAVPQGKLFLAAAILLLGSYVVLSGADYLDSPHLQILQRRNGVRKTVEAALCAPA